jgi:hypothetical protein
MAKVFKWSILKMITSRSLVIILIHTFPGNCLKFNPFFGGEVFEHVTRLKLVLNRVLLMHQLSIRFYTLNHMKLTAGEQIFEIKFLHSRKFLNLFVT